jgi:hypothetical protein
MSENQAEPVEISTRMRPSEWSAESLLALVSSYQHKLREMGAPENEIVTDIQKPDDGSASVRVSWKRQGVQTFSDPSPTTPPETKEARGDGESIPGDEATNGSQGLGAILGDAEWSAIDAPPTPRAREAAQNQTEPDVLIYTDADGKTYAEDAGTPKE